MLLAYRDGEPRAFDELVALVYDDLRRIAHRQLAGRRRNATLDTTALVHEAYLKLVDQTRATFNDRSHFYGVAARAMRQILVDYARARSALKRGDGAPAVSLDQVQVGIAGQIEWLVTLDDALERLGSLNPRLTRVFECRYFGGLTDQETAAALSVPLRTVQRDWKKGKLWLQRELAPA